MSWLEDNINSIVSGNCYELIKLIPDKSIDAIYTDPPYDFHCCAGEGGIFKNRVTGKYDDIKGTILTKGIDNSILYEFIRVMKNINIYLWCNKTQIKGYLNFFSNYDTLFEILTWHKTNPTPMTKNTFLPDTEYCLYFREKGMGLNDGYELKHKYFLSKQNKEDKELYNHPTIKPLSFVKTHILHSTQPNDIVLDPFAGSGTTCVACRETDRQFAEIMKQKCRYCANCIVGDVAYCDLKHKTMSDVSAKRINKCAEFEFNPMDAFGEKDYQEPKTEAEDSIDQIGLDLNG